MKIDNTQQNSKRTLFENRDETVNHNEGECRRLAQKEEKTRHDWVGKGVYWELCKRLEFDHTAKWYMHKSESVQKNKTHKIFWEFEI